MKKLELEMNIINNKGEEELKKFTITKYPDKMEYYRLEARYRSQTSDPFAAVIHFANEIFPKCVEGIEIIGMDKDVKYSQLLNEFFTNDPEALDALLGETMGFQKTSIDRKVKKIVN